VSIDKYDYLSYNVINIIMEVKSMNDKSKQTEPNELELIVNAVQNHYAELDENMQKKLFAILKHTVEKEPNNTLALSGLGECYYKGIGVKIDPNTAIEYLTQAGNLGDCFSCMRLGLYFYTSAIAFGEEENKETAFQWLLKASKMGDSLSKLYLSKMYNNGWGVEENESESFRWISSAANDKLTASYYELGRHYEKGWGTEKNMEKAFSWYLKSAKEHQDEDAMYKVAICYRDGTGVRQNPQEAIKWLQKAADEGINNAKTDLAKMYFADVFYNSTSFVPNYSKAEKLLLDVIENASDEEEKNYALITCGYLYNKMENYDKEFTIWERVAQNNIIEGYFQLGLAYWGGLGVDQNLDTAIMWLNKASEAGHEQAPSALQEIKDITAKTKKSGGCYIATAVYGSYDCPEVWTLRRYRDYVLSETWIGRIFIKSYYSISPTLVAWFGNTNWFIRFFKRILDRMINELRSQGIEDTPYDDKKY